MRRAGSILLFLILFCSTTSSVGASEVGSVVISEIAWMGTFASSADEWLELYNNTDSEISLEGWGIYEAGGETLIESLEGNIPADSFYLLERTNEETVSDISASQPPSSWSGGGLSNGGEHLVIKDSEGQVIDEVASAAGWFAGNSLTKKSMERISFTSSGSDPDNWRDNDGVTVNGLDAEGSHILGTPLMSNSSGQEEDEQGGNWDSYAEIAINELLPNPVGSDDQEFIELYNYGGQEVDLGTWIIADQSSEKQISNVAGTSNTVINSGGYLVLYRRDGSVSLNNGGDTITLYAPDGTEIDDVSYTSLAEGNAYAREADTWQETTLPTPGQANVIEFEGSSQDDSQFDLISISEAKEVSLGETVAVEGFVTAEPNVVGTDIFYIQDSSAGIRVKLGTGDSPSMSLGDQVSLQGELNKSWEELYIKIVDNNAIHVGSRSQQIVSQEVGTGVVGERIEGLLVIVEGSVVEVSGSNFWIDDGSGRGKVTVSDSGSIERPVLTKGQRVRVTGVISQWGEDNYRLLPRLSSEIVVLSSSLEGNLGVAGSGEIPANSSILGVASSMPLEKPVMKEGGWLTLLTKGGSEIIGKQKKEDFTEIEKAESSDESNGERLGTIVRYAVLASGFGSLLYLKRSGYY